MIIIRAFAVSLLCLGICLSCQKKDPQASSTFLIPWPSKNESNELVYRLQSITLTTLPSPFELRGGAAEVYFGTGLAGSKPEGRPAHPRVIEVDGVYVPQDVDSALSIAAYAHFEYLQKFDQQQGFSSRVSWPRRVSVETPIIDEKGQREVNQARYLYNEDIISISPSDTLGVPMALNAGVLAHEHFHAIFEVQFMKNLRSLPQHWPVEDVILRGWNEGLADFYAASYIKHPRFLVASSSAFIDESRRLDTDIHPFAEKLSLASEINLYQNHPGCSQGYCISYREGTKLARFLYQTSQRLSSLEQASYFQSIMNALEPASRITLQQMQRQELVSSSLVPLLVSEEWIVKAKACDLLRRLYDRQAALIQDFSVCAAKGSSE